jgi:hypothetical protein
MPNLSCWSCGRQIYTVSPIEALFAEERRCPRCGAYLHKDRRETERRIRHRRLNPANDPGPPKPKAKPKVAKAAKAPPKQPAKRADAPVAGERRVADRRTVRRRGSPPKPPETTEDRPG